MYTRHVTVISNGDRARAVHLFLVTIIRQLSCNRINKQIGKTSRRPTETSYSKCAIAYNHKKTASSKKTTITINRYRRNCSVSPKMASFFKWYRHTCQCYPIRTNLVQTGTYCVLFIQFYLTNNHVSLRIFQVFCSV